MIDTIIEERRKKFENLKNAGFYPFPEKVSRTKEIKELIDRFSEISESGKSFFICGRIVGFRNQGKIFFLDVVDETGKIQGVAKGDALPNFKLFQENLDLGDFVEISGTLFITQKNEKSVLIQTLRPIAKSFRPIPSQWFGIENVETKLRKRYLDVLLNPETKEIFRKKNVFWQTFRNCLEDGGFLEVETPILEAVPGGADAEPFTTHHNALDTDFYLRISLEISLKKLLVAGYDKVFEIGRIFRNEGIDTEHLQDYTQLEFYWAYSDYSELMKFIEDLYKQVVEKTTGGLKTEYRGERIDWSGKWEKVEYYEIFKEKTGLDLNVATDAELIEKAKNSGLNIKDADNRGRVIDLLFKKFCRPVLIQPCFLVDPPADIEPLAKRLEKNPAQVARFQVLAAGTELGKGFSEANDPLDQRERFEIQMAMREKGDKEAQILDEDFIEALEYGMPPASGFGVSERLFAVLMDKPVRETVIFPPMKRENK